MNASATSGLFSLVTDSTCDLGPAELMRLGVRCLPLTVHLQGQEYRDWADLDPESLYGRMREGHQASTEPPSVEAFVQAYSEALQAGKPVISIHLSGHISQTVEHARAAAEQLGAGDQIRVIDSKTASAGLAEYLLTAVSMRDQGMSVEETAENLAVLGAGMYSEFMVPNLEFLRRGGRLSRTAHLMGNLTGLRPVLGFDEEGRIVPRRRVRVHQAEQQLVQQLQTVAQDRPVAVTVYLAGRDQARLLELQRAVKAARLNLVRGRMQLIGCVIGAHIGPGAYGFLVAPAGRG